jgi:hypothetical protein
MAIEVDWLEEGQKLEKLGVTFDEELASFEQMNTGELSKLGDERRHSLIHKRDAALKSRCADLNRIELERANNAREMATKNKERMGGSLDIQKLLSYYESVLGYYYVWYFQQGIEFPLPVTEQVKLTAAQTAGLHRNVDEIEAYLQAVTQNENPNPTLEQLSAIMDSPATWSRRLNNPVFLGMLKTAVDKKMNLARSDNTKKLWQAANESLIQRVEARTQRRTRSHEKQIGGRIENMPGQDQFDTNDEEADQSKN